MEVAVGRQGPERLRHPVGVVGVSLFPQRHRDAVRPGKRQGAERDGGDTSGLLDQPAASGWAAARAGGQLGVHLQSLGANIAGADSPAVSERPGPTASWVRKGARNRFAPFLVEKVA